MVGLMSFPYVTQPLGNGYYTFGAPVCHRNVRLGS